MIARFLKIIYLTGVAWPIALSPVHAQITVAALEPVQLVRSLQSLQDDIAAGQAGALQMQPRVLAEIGQKFLAADPSTWENAQNLYAVLTYLFNGGNPQVVETILKTSPEGVISKNMVDGALAYAHHRKATFLKAFANMPDESAHVPSALLLSIALSTVADMAEQDPVAAMKRLDRVRLLAPGSLFEEAAIRRQIKVATMTGDIPRLRLLTRNYVDRFAQSPYANEFWREFSFSLPQLDTHLTDQQLDDLIGYAPVMVQFIVYMKVSRAALIDARMQRAHFGAGKALELARKLNTDDTSARLYYAASSVGSTSAEEAGQMLKTISINDLPERDRPLLLAAKAVAKGVVLDTTALPAQVHEEDDSQTTIPEAVGLPVDQVDAKAETPLPVPTDVSAGRSDATKTSGEIDQFMKQAQEKLEAVDKLLEKKP